MRPTRTRAWALLARSPDPRGRWGICGLGWTKREAREHYLRHYPSDDRARWITRTVRCVVQWSERGVTIEDLDASPEPSS